MFAVDGAGELSEGGLMKAGKRVSLHSTASAVQISYPNSKEWLAAEIAEKNARSASIEVK